jgi:hypothetical protein
MKFKTRMINAAVAAALGTVAGAAQAVNLGTEHQGQVLLYPYYTTQIKGTNPFDTLITVVNSDSVRGKAVKVRFREAKASREVLDFNLYLSPNDVWTGAITRDSANNAVLRTSDNSCTAPQLGTTGGGNVTIVAGVTIREQPFVNFGYTGDELKDDSLARAREGYLEMIQMADTAFGVLNGDNLDTFVASKHVSNVPPNCAAIVNSFISGTGYPTASTGVLAPTGGLSGTGTILNPGEGSDMSYNAVALDSFSDVANHQLPGSTNPDLFSVSPLISGTLDGAGSYVLSAWAIPIQAVDATIDRHEIVNEYAVATTPVGLGTDWVVTFPTKRQHYQAPVGTAAVPAKPFTASLTTTGACEAVSLTSYNREEATQTTGLQFSPTQTGGTFLCYEVNVISMQSGSTISNALGSASPIRTVLPQPFSEGWIRMAFGQTMVAPASVYLGIAQPNSAGVAIGATAAFAAVTYTGLPVIGFSDQTFLNQTTLAAFGTGYEHRYTRSLRHP